MNITTSTLTRGTAVAAALAGLAYIVIQFIHPADVVASLSTQQWVVVHILSFVEAVLAVVGVTGIYLRQVRQFGILGLIGYLMFGFFFILQSAFNFAEAFIAPLFVVDAPQTSTDFVGLFGRYAPVTDLGPLTALPQVGAVLYVVGAILFGIAIIRARMLSRGAGILLIAAAAVTPIAGALLPHTLERMAAIPMGLALVWFGYSLWYDLRANATALQAHTDEAGLDRASR
ncbi:hypothetical protein E3O25_01895 [Cryobacterium sp. TMT1-3]|uniref:DUF4386 family protein n=1 Tax=Cryobacterium luteum TaxID=1424661 RepID=A0A1H8CUF1_9MICO|nr:MULTISPECIES: hypothetical protein [Cryobacterium]TFB91793.1 hypothetical protein E3O10_05300 [Cryobacterium luteum]TFC31233.1 hypothetical protein E3O25_01895 [Cryobacterium sp. TMT1-3]SEM98753.1 hypothetical protein SAMN05216281_10317 [Cryobacterium luteum]